LWQLGQLPPGLYRDEAANGLDALNVLQGEHTLFFPANNGREPVYIYLTSLSLFLFERSAMSVRLAAAIVGTLTTVTTYLLAKSWFGLRVGLLSAWLWAITFWPVHLSRVGLRPILVAPLLAIVFWLGTLAYLRRRKGLWLLSGLCYGVAFYTYLPVRFTPALLLSLCLYLALSGRWQRVKLNLPWFALGTFLALAPLAYIAVQQPELVLGRTGQVSILSPVINQGDLWGTLWENGIRALGMFLWRGDTILRHNPAGRPVFDMFMALPFLLGLAWSLRQWRQPAAMGLLLWIGIMLGPTVLAEDSPHFLRAAGLLPALMIVPAIGLHQLWTWSRLPRAARQLAVLFLLAASALTTARDYLNYGSQPDVAYLFETAASELAQQINAESAATDVFLDERFWLDRPSIEFLVGERPISLFRPETGVPGPIGPDLAVYGWPYGPLDYLPRALLPPAMIMVEEGGLARGDLDESANPLYVRYWSHPIPSGLAERIVSFEDQLHLLRADVNSLEDNILEVEIIWQMGTAIRQDLALFIHVLGTNGSIVAQEDGLVSNGRWPREWWRPGLLIGERRAIELPSPYDSGQHRLQLGVYDMHTRVRLQVLDRAGEEAGDAWTLDG
jgi:4-amino-4-deoxy-L-arabinose transferase-like glycosyltransferase